MEGTAKRRVNAEDMLAELKRALEASARAPDAPPRSASTAPKSSSPGRDNRRSQIEGKSDRPVTAIAASSTGEPTALPKPTRPRSRRWKLTAGGLALAGAAAVCASVALTRDQWTHELTTEGMVRSESEQALKPSSESRSLAEPSQAAPSQAGALETRVDASPASADNGAASATGKAAADAPNLASSGIESAPPAFTLVPASTPAILAPSHAIRPDGTPIAAALSTPALIDTAPAPAQTPKPAVPTAAPQMVKPDKATVATAPSTPASTDSAPPPALTPKPAALTAAPQMVKPDKASVATAPPAPASTNSAPPPAPAPKPNATRTASVSNESPESSTPKIDSKKKLPEKPSPQKLLRSPTPPAKPVGQAERQSTEPAPAKEADRLPQPAQNAGNPTAAAPVKAPSVQQRVADGVTHAFGYLMHLPGALVPHLGGSNPNAQ
jgi:hypothetical protein